MLKYALFIIRISLRKFNFFSLPLDQKIHMLKQNNLFFEAGVLYKKHGDYHRAKACFNQAGAYHQSINCHLHLNDYSSALSLCNTHKLYKLGAQIAVDHDYDLQAAYFYSFFDLPLAIRYYKRHQLYYELAICYLKQYRFQLAYDTFLKCQNTSQKHQGVKLIEEAAVTLYLKGQYTEAAEIFIHMNDYLSAMECAKKMQHTPLILDISNLLATYYLQENLLDDANYFLKISHAVNH